MSYTEQMESTVFEQWDGLDYENEDYASLISMLNDENSFRTFGEGLISFLQIKLPVVGEESAIKYIETLCEKNNVPKNVIASVNTFKSWFNGGPRPKKGEDSRRSMFALAFALQLSPTETADLFHKVYLDRAFDYRNENEIIYYYCLSNKKTWKDAERLISTSVNVTCNNNDATILTSQIMTDIDSIIDETALLNYIEKHGHNLSKRNESANKIREKLLAEANTIAKIEAGFVENSERFKGSNKDSLSFTYEMIIGHEVSGQKGTKTIFKNSRLPKEIRNRFPEAITLSKKEPTYEELRKLIILLFSYKFWYNMQKTNKIVEIDDYIEDINHYLNESGFSPIYYGNPYDWVFLFCTLSETRRPLDTFRGLIADVLDEE